MLRSQQYVTPSEVTKTPRKCVFNSGGMYLRVYTYPGANRSIPNHPTVIALEKACREGKLGRQWLERCLNAKEAEMLDEEWTNLSDMEEYAEAAFSSLIYSSIECLGVSETESINTAASHLGIAQGLTTLFCVQCHIPWKPRIEFLLGGFLQKQLLG